MTERRIMCIYHGNCADGFTAAWAVWKALGDRVEFVPGVYGAAPPDVTGADARVFSLRSRSYDGLDVAAIAASYGGGGHRNAAGFQMPLGWEGDE